MKEFFIYVLIIIMVFVLGFGVGEWINNEYPHKIGTEWDMENHVCITTFSDGHTETSPLSGFWYD